MKVYLLEHTTEERTIYDDGDTKIIGVFSTKEEAEKAIQNLSDKPGFKDYIDGFNIDCYLLNEINWTSGFGDN